MGEVEDFRAMLEWLQHRDDVPANGPGWAMSLITLRDRLFELMQKAPRGPVQRQLKHFWLYAHELALYEAGAQKVVILALKSMLGAK